MPFVMMCAMLNAYRQKQPAQLSLGHSNLLRG